MSDKLKSLEEHNITSSNFNSSLNAKNSVPNGIECPKCGAELLDTRPNEILTSVPPKKNVGCSRDTCDYTGYRIA